MPPLPPHLPFVLLLILLLLISVTNIVYPLAVTGADDESHLPDLDALVRQQLEKAGEHVVAFSAVGVRDGQIAWQFVSGMADHRKSEPVTPSTRFMWASVSKTVVSYAAMLLVDRDIIGLDEDVSSRVGFAVRHPHFRETNITLRMLMTHMASINDAYEYSVLPETCVKGDAALPNGAWLREYLTPGGRFCGGVDAAVGSWLPGAPGTSYEYSNEGASLAALVAERAAQAAGLISPTETVSDLVRRHVLPALGVESEDAASYFLSDLPDGPSELQKPSAYYYDRRGGRGLEQYFTEYPCGRWEAAPRDQVRLMLNFIGNGTSAGLPPLLNASTVAEMKRPQSIVRPPQQDPQALIWYYRQQGGRTLLGHDGCDWGTATATFFNPATGAGYAVATSSDCEDKAASAPIEAIKIAILDALEGQKASAGIGTVAAVAQLGSRGSRSRRDSSRRAAGAMSMGQPYDACNDTSLPKPCWWLCV